jgi:hypothetical protein
MFVEIDERTSLMSSICNRKIIIIFNNKATRNQVSLRIEKTSKTAFIKENFAGRYNHCVKCYNESSFEVTHENAATKLSMRGSRFFFQKVVIVVYLIGFIIACIGFRDVILVMGVFLGVCLIYWLLIIYNFFVVFRNGSLIAKNFVYSRELCDDSINEFYDIELNAIQQNSTLATDLNLLLVYVRNNQITAAIKIMAYYSVYLKRTRPYKMLAIHVVLNSIIIYFLCDLINKANNK